MGAIPSGKCGERFPHPKGRIWRDPGVGRPAAMTCCCSGQGGVRERKGGWGRRGRRGPWILALSRQPAWRDREGHIIAGLGICRASGVGTTSPLCRAIVCPSPVSTAFCTWWRGRSFWSRHWEWRDRLALSRHLNWRDKHRILLLCPTSAAAPCFWCSLATACFCCWCSSC